MDRPAQLAIVRHAESKRNRAKKENVYFPDDASRAFLRGIPDHQIPLTKCGIEQARQTGLALARLFPQFDYAYHSGYLRTQHTLELLLNAFGSRRFMQTQVRSNEFIRERDPGHTYDMTTEEVNAAFPYLAEHWRTSGGYFARPPGGESIADVAQRVYLFLNMLFRDRAGQRLLVVTHSGVIRALRHLLEHKDYAWATKWAPDERPHNCSVTIYEYDHQLQRLELRECNSVHYDLGESHPE